MTRNRIKELERLIPVGIIAVGICAGCASKGYVQKELGSLEGRIDQVDATATQAASDAREARDLAMRGSEQAQQALVQAELAREIALGNVRHEVVRKVTIYFRFDSSALDDDAKRQLDAVAGEVQANPKYLALITGHADATGDDRYNLALSERRAARVRQYLAERLGSDFVRLATVGFGDIEPAGDNATAEGRRQNRRVEIVIVIPVPAQVQS